MPLDQHPYPYRLDNLEDWRNLPVDPEKILKEAAQEPDYFRFIQTGFSYNLAFASRKCCKNIYDLYQYIGQITGMDKELPPLVIAEEGLQIQEYANDSAFFYSPTEGFPEQLLKKYPELRKGFICVNISAIDYSLSMEELGGILGHELRHYYQRNSPEWQEKEEKFKKRREDIRKLNHKVYDREGGATNEQAFARFERVDQALYKSEMRLQREKEFDADKHTPFPGGIQGYLQKRSYSIRERNLADVKKISDKIKTGRHTLSPEQVVTAPHFGNFIDRADITTTERGNSVRLRIRGTDYSDSQKTPHPPGDHRTRILKELQDKQNNVTRWH